MNKNFFKKTKAIAFILLACVFFLSSLRTPEVTADVTIFSIKPDSGKVGEMITINATIETENGFYVVRWNGTLNVTTGYAVEYTVLTSFTVPQTAGAPQGLDIPVELIDNTTGTTGKAYFELLTEYYIEAVTPPSPLQLQEGANTTLWVNITGGESDTSYVANITVEDPANNTYASLATLNTNNTGYGEKNVTYPEDFGIEAHTNYTGTYTVTFNETLATSEFFIGLTNATEYALFQTMNIRAANYTHPGEHVWVNITYNGETIFSENRSAIDGMIETNWAIPVNASIGNYTVTITNSTAPGTRKPVDDTQRFVVKKPVFTVQIKTENLNNEPVSSILVEAHNETAKVDENSTDAAGVTTFLLEMANYTFKALLKDVEVGVLPNQSIMENKVETKALTLKCLLTNIKMLVIDKEGSPVPFIGLNVNYSYTTRLNAKKNETLSFTTNYTGVWKLFNTFTNISYVIEARRYGHIFNQTPISRMLVQPWFNITIILPTYTASIHVADSKNNATEGVRVEAYEWSGESARDQITDSNGNVAFSLNFGRYRIRVYNATTLLSETIVDLTKNQSFNIYLSVYNIDFTVAVVDYFGQPISNAMVKIERKTGTKYEATAQGPTGSKGLATFNGIMGGDSRITISVGGQLSGSRDLCLTDSEQITFHLNRYMVIAGYAVETSRFVTAIALAVLIAAFIVASTYKRLLKTLTKSK